jgi:general secretion pathway protein D
VKLSRIAVLCLVLAAVLKAADPSAASLFRRGRAAERKGDVVSAYLLYSQAAALDPKEPKYWQRSQALRTRAALKAKPLPKLDASEKSAEMPVASVPTGIGPAISADDLADVARMLPPPELKPKPGRQNLNLRGDAKAIFEQTAKAFGLDTIFDGDYQPGPPLRLDIADTDYRDALRAVQAATNSFVVPLGEKLILVVKDTPQKRAEAEPSVAVTVPIPDPVTVQEAQELARAVQQAMEIQKLAVDGERRMVLIKDRISKVRTAQALFQQLAFGKPQVEIGVEFLEIDQSSFYSYGFLMPNKFPIVYAGNGLVSGATQSLAKIFFGHTLLGLGIANANLFANMNRSSAHTLLQAQVRSSDGQPASFHAGDRYPVATAGFLGTQTGTPIPPTFQFEDLGLLLKITPHVHGDEGISLDVEAEFKLLGGQSLNGIPVISTRKFQSKVRLENGEWAIAAGLMSNSEARALSGMAGLINLPVIGPLFRRTDVTGTSTQVLLILKPRIVSRPAAEFAVGELFVGSETKMQIPL